MSLEERIKGCVYGHAVGDALGVGCEFMSKEDVKKNYPTPLRHYSEIVQDAWRLKFERGDWTDDTDMALCILMSYGNLGYVDLKDIAGNFHAWFLNCRDCGNQTGMVLSSEGYVEDPIETAFKVWKKRGAERSAGNGGIMRAAVCGLFKHSGKDLENYAADICRLTHWDPRCVGSSVIVAEVINKLVYDDYVLTPEEAVEIGERYDPAIREYIDLASRGDLEALKLDEPGKFGYTLKTLSAALWSLWHATDFESGIVSVVNEGGDADTNGAPSGSILGCKFGFSSIPEDLVDGLVGKNILQEVYEAL